MTDFSFPNSEHLKSRKTIAGLFSGGNSVKGFPIRFQYNIRPIEDSNDVNMNVGFVVTKRNFKKAVDRNRIKRQMKEVFRLNRTILNESLQAKNMHLDMMVIFINASPSSYQQIQKGMNKGIEKLCSIL